MGIVWLAPGVSAEVFLIMGCCSIGGLKGENSLTFGPDIRDEYLVQEKVGEGCYGQVRKCINLKTNEMYACTHFYNQF